ncbi:MAG: tetratricopeptide repeat protein [Pseudomonadota bacterium]
MAESYKTEEEQVEAIKAWWKENGMSIVAGITIGLVAIFGWRGYNQHKITQAYEASSLYEQMILSARNNDVENSRVYADRIIADHETSMYGIFAKLMLAKLEAENNQLEQAVANLEWVIGNTDEPQVTHIATLRLARLYIDQEQLESAKSLLNKANQGEFIAQYEELKGDVFLKQGDINSARQAYQKALLNTIASEESQSVIEMKLDNLGKG